MPTDEEEDDDRWWEALLAGKRAFADRVHKQIRERGFFEAPQRFGGKLTLTRSTYPGVVWQMTRWEDDGTPTGHVDLQTVDDAIKWLYDEVDHKALKGLAPNPSDDGWGELSRARRSPSELERSERQLQEERARIEEEQRAWEQEARELRKQHRAERIAFDLQDERIAIVAEALKHRLDIENAIGMQLGSLLGCGVWGCVVETEPPWVVKLTLDPKEPDAWRSLLDADAGPGIPVVRGITRIGKITAIVREDCPPVFDRPGDSGHHDVATDLTTSITGMRSEDLKEAVTQGRIVGTLDGRHALVLSGEDPNAVPVEASELVSTMLFLSRYNWATQNDTGVAPSIIRQARIIDLGVVGTSLLNALESILPKTLPDLHPGNIGWRVVEEFGPRCVVITDPGGRRAADYVPNQDRRSLWARWRELVNMNTSELRRFLDSAEGQEAGLSPAQARAQGIKSGRESARAILKMQPRGRSFSAALRNWTPSEWVWARRQVSFISRMRGARGPLYDAQGRPTRKLLALLVWGHDPEAPLRDV